MFEQASAAESVNGLSDWMIRGAITLIFVLAGADKFGESWVAFFQQVGVGQWFRYFTGVVEIAGGILVLIPLTVEVGLALLACTMASAALIVTFVLGRPGDSPFSAALLVALLVFWWNRRSRGRSA